MFPVTHLLRLVLLLLVPLWLSLGAEALGIRLPFASVLSDWMHARKPIDPALVPPPGWREATYLDANPDIAAAVRSGVIVSGYAHYLQHGRAEGRPGGLPDAGLPQAGGASAGTPAADPVHQVVEELPGKVPERAPDKAEPNRTVAVAAAAASTAAVPTPAPPEPPATQTPAFPQPVTSNTILQAAAMSAAVPEPPAAKPPAPPPAGRPQTAAQLAPQPVPLPASKPAPPQQPQGGSVLVSGLRTGNSGGTIRIVLDLDRPPRFEAPASRPDGSLTVTLPGTVWKTTPSGRLPTAGWSYRAEPAGEGSRLTILGGEGGPAAVKAIFAMAPDGDRSHRLVIDLTVPPPASPPPSNKPKPAARTATAEQKRT